jgi:hypothetical protein
MSKLAWSRVGERFFETGVDRGVIYPNKEGMAPAAWSGLIGINENPTGGEDKPFYIDGYKFQNRSTPEEYVSTTEAFTYPRVFDECQGNSYLGNGLYMTAQTKVPFGLTYRTKLGNDVAGQNYAHKIHFVYNALVAPTNKNYQTVGDNPTANTFSWTISTKAMKVTGRRQTAHMVVDTSLLTSPLLAELEDLIYGTDSTEPELPSPTELIELIVGWPTLFITDHGNGIFTASGPDDVVRLATPRAYEISAETAEADGEGNFEVTSY